MRKDEQLLIPMDGLFASTFRICTLRGDSLGDQNRNHRDQHHQHRGDIGYRAVARLEHLAVDPNGKSLLQASGECRNNNLVERKRKRKDAACQ